MQFVADLVDPEATHRRLPDISRTPPGYLRDTSKTPRRHLADTSQTPPRHLRDATTTFPTPAPSQAGFLAESVHSGDVVALQKWRQLLSFEEDVRLRCERDRDVAPHAHLLRPKLRESLSHSLASVCAQHTPGLSP